MTTMIVTRIELDGVAAAVGACCQACGTEQISLEALQATSRLQNCDEDLLDVFRQNFDGEVPSVLCAVCFLAHYSNAVNLAHKEVRA